MRGRKPFRAYAHTSYALRGIPKEMANIAKGSSFQAPEWWITLANATYEERGFTQESLAERVGCDQGTISKLLGGAPSRVVNQVADILGIPRPQLIIGDPEEGEWHRLGQTIRRDPEKYARVRAKIVRIAASVAESTAGEDDLEQE